MGPVFDVDTCQLWSTANWICLEKLYLLQVSNIFLQIFGQSLQLNGVLPPYSLWKSIDCKNNNGFFCNCVVLQECIKNIQTYLQHQCYKVFHQRQTLLLESPGLLIRLEQNGMIFEQIQYKIILKPSANLLEVQASLKTLKWIRLKLKQIHI